jgi:hypothetical protein
MRPATSNVNSMGAEGSFESNLADPEARWPRLKYLRYQTESPQRSELAFWARDLPPCGFQFT